MLKLKTLIIEDNPLARESLKLQLNELDVIELAGEADGVLSGLKLLRSVKPDLLFLDIELEDGDGFEILELAGDMKARVIFVTASEQFAIRAFRVAALDYLLKPVDPELLKNAVEKARFQNIVDKSQFRMLKELASDRELREIVLHTQDKIRIVAVDQIIRCEAMGNYTHFYFADGTKLLVTKTLKHFEQMLSPYQFIRTHQSHLVNRDWIVEYVKKEGGYLLLREGSTVAVSYRKKGEVIAILGK